VALDAVNLTAFMIRNNLALPTTIYNVQPSCWIDNNAVNKYPVYFVASVLNFKIIINFLVPLSEMIGQFLNST